MHSIETFPRDTPSYLFIGGNPRSGTSALTSLINHHPDAVVGMERYAPLWGRDELTPAHFTAEEFFAPRDFDAGKRAREFERERYQARYDKTVLRGDKYPYVTRHLDYITSTFPGCQVLFILRNPLSVSESFQARFDNPDDKAFALDGIQALTRWNNSLRQLADGLAAGLNIAVVTYERAFASREAATRIFETVGLPPESVDWLGVDRVVQRAAELNVAETSRNEATRWKIAMEANFDLYRKMVNEACILRDM
ncbi:sulfotransferase [Maricaulis sp. W15]|uniref:sulfotransferase family protein n=1 Tax=Maricaulis sp. W15 TaxID=1772333 RepID=UPI00094914F3|nr:sulfotransferase [Maricaulis sp. W15]